MVTTDQLRAFLTIADLGNLTAASGRLHKTQSAVSAQLKNLEATVGVALFERAARGMILTEQGERFLPQARTTLRELGALTSMFNDALSGTIRIGVPDDFEDGRLEHLLGTFAQTHPGVEVRITSGCTHDFEEAIARDDLDIAVKSGPTYGAGDPLYEENIVWVTASTRKGAAFECIPLALLDRDCWWRQIPQTALDAAGKPYRIAFSSSSFASVCSAVQAGLAVSIVPERVVTDRMRILAERDGFPRLPTIRRTILSNAHASQDLVDAVRTAFLSLAGKGT